METVDGGVTFEYQEVAPPLPAFRKGRGLTTTIPPHLLVDRGGRDLQLSDPGPNHRVVKGSAVITGDGVETQFRWLHTADDAPDGANVAHSTGISEPKFSTVVDATHVTITFDAPLRSGDFTMNWEAVAYPRV